jgi:hypothetical protein
MAALLIQGHRYMQGHLFPMQTVLVPHDCPLVQMTWSKHFSSTGKHPNWQPKREQPKRQKKKERKILEIISGKNKKSMHCTIRIGLHLQSLSVTYPAKFSLFLQQLE